MKELYASGQAAALSLGAALCLAAAVAAVPAHAQRGGARPASVERRMEQVNRQAQQYEREELSREMKAGKESPAERRPTQAAVAQIKHDFEHLQAGYNQLVLLMKSERGFDYDSVSGAVAEVHKCAARLKGHLALPRPQPEEAREPRAADAEPAGLKESLLALRKHIYSFVANPLFEKQGVLDVEQAGRASRDLERIIELSEAIRKNGDRRRQPVKP